MHLTKEEIKLAAVSLLFLNNGETRRFPTSDIKLSSEAFKLLESCVSDDEHKSYKDSDVEMASEAKELIKRCAEEREWSVIDGPWVISLLEKLG